MFDILLLEDDPTQAARTVRSLRARGYSVEIARDISDARAALAAAEHRVVIADVHLGADDSRRLLAEQAGWRGPVVAVTADETIGSDPPQGCDVVLRKSDMDSRLFCILPMLLMGWRTLPR